MDVLDLQVYLTLMQHVKAILKLTVKTLETTVEVDRTSKISGFTGFKMN